MGTAQCEDEAEPAVEGTAAASNEVAEVVRKDHSETYSSEAGSSSESQGEFTIKVTVTCCHHLLMNDSCPKQQGKLKQWRAPHRALSGEGKGERDGKGGRERGRLAGRAGGWGARGARVARVLLCRSSRQLAHAWSGLRDLKSPMQPQIALGLNFSFCSCRARNSSDLQVENSLGARNTVEGFTEGGPRGRT